MLSNELREMLKKVQGGLRFEDKHAEFSDWCKETLLPCIEALERSCELLVVHQYVWKDAVPAYCPECERHPHSPNCEIAIALKEIKS